MEYSNRGFRFLQSKEMEDNNDIANFTITTDNNHTVGDQVVSATVDQSSAGGAAGGGELEEGSSAGSRRREHMFDKVVTPSDVGKLNRLVIPKQHAERYFPLDTASNEKGLILNFEDTTGKSWRFRYSYWNSSQSYVMTKGWSRFVKEKRLDAGDTVSFERSMDQLSGETRLFISWKRRQDAPAENQLMPRLFWPVMPGQPQPVLAPSLQRPGYFDYYNYGQRYTEPTPCPLYYLRARTTRDQLTERGDNHTSSSLPPPPAMRWVPETVLDSEPVLDRGKSTNKSVRLFGVNLECPTAMEVEDEQDDNEESGGSSTGCGVDGDGLSSSSSMTDWLSQSSSHLQLRLHAGGDESQLAMSPNPRPDLSRKGKHPSLSFDL